MEKVKEEIAELQTVEKLLDYQSKYHTAIRCSKEEAEIILDYFEGHDYVIGHKNGVMLRGDINDKLGETIWEEYGMDDVIDLVCEWNYEFILEAQAERETAKDMIEFGNLQSRYEYLKFQEEVLDGLFDRTKYRMQIETLAVKFAENLISHLIKGNDISNTVNSITTSLPKLETMGRAR